VRMFAPADARARPPEDPNGREGGGCGCVCIPVVNVCMLALVLPFENVNMPSRSEWSANCESCEEEIVPKTDRSVGL
jgi:hypothetical protein